MVDSELGGVLGEGGWGQDHAQPLGLPRVQLGLQNKCAMAVTVISAEKEGARKLGSSSSSAWKTGSSFVELDVDGLTGQH